MIEGYRLARFELPPPRLLGDSQVRIESHWIGSLELSSSSGHVGLGRTLRAGLVVVLQRKDEPDQPATPGRIVQKLDPAGP